MFPRRRRLRSTRRVEEGRRTFFIRLGLLSAIMFASLAILSLLSHLPETTITQVGVSGTSLVVPDDIKILGHDHLSGRYLGVVSRAHTLLYPKDRIRETLLDTYPQIASLDIRRSDLTTLQVVVDERQPRHLWCGGEPSGHTVRSQCYFLDDEGVIFAKAPRFSGSVFLEIYMTPEGASVREQPYYEAPLGHYLFAGDGFTRVVSLHDRLEEQGLAIERLICDTNNDCSFFLDNGVALHIARSDEVDEIMQAFETILKTDRLSMKHLTERDSRLEYIDLRFNNRAFFRFEGNESTP